ncbi:hypothetical protein LTR37_006907 [Vermiconidia calcicola]|uniref:Uncharacterized protein n=1 Tax=Vermiconidia calcicola TaxID=1690605 RepID=A0ACC3NF66_9PEZI|nr:hypothetical protein LTR37_006907 [Vermiconidia calcicola]
MTSQQPKIPDQVRTQSHGRGGAGNINSKPVTTTVGADDLQTPTIKSTTYTTGRGGTGNMAVNTDPTEARMAQDVEAPVHHQNDPKGTYHWGRGGEGNKMLVGGGEKHREKSKERKNSKGERSESFLKKGKDMLGLKGKKGDEKGGSAIEDD